MDQERIRNDVGPKRLHHKAPTSYSNAENRQTRSFQLIQQREYVDATQRPWKVIFPLEVWGGWVYVCEACFHFICCIMYSVILLLSTQEDLKEPASTIILKRLEKIREPTFQDQSVTDQNLPTLLEQCEENKFKSSDTTWTVLFQDPVSML